MSIKQLTSIIVILAIFSLGGWLMVFLIPQISPPEQTIIINQSAISLEKKLQELLIGGQNLKLQEFQKTLKSFVALPLPIRAGGKDNPFLPVTKPTDQFSSPASSAGAKTTSLPNKNISNRR